MAESTRPLPPGEPALDVSFWEGNWRVLALWAAQGASQAAQSALLFTLLVLVLELTRSTLSTSVLVLSFLAPSVLFGIAAGILVDRWNKRRVMVVTSLLRLVVMLTFLFFHDTLWTIYALNVAFSTASQFFPPAQTALIPALVRRDQLIHANSVFSLTLMGSQFVGLVILAPALLIALGADALFAVLAGLYAVSAVASALLPDTERGMDLSARLAGRTLLQGVREEFRSGWELLRRDRAAALGVAHLAVGNSLVVLFAVLVPSFMREVLALRADKAVFVFAPTGVGALVGLRLLPWFTGRVAKHYVTVAGLTGIAVTILGFAVVEPLASLMERFDPLDPFQEEVLARLGGLSILVALTMVLAVPLGVAYALVNAPAQTLLHERTPPEMRGRIFAAQLVFANVVSLIPLMLLAAVTDIIGVTLTLVVVATLVAAVALGSLLWERLGPPLEGVAAGVGAAPGGPGGRRR